MGPSQEQSIVDSLKAIERSLEGLQQKNLPLIVSAINKLSENQEQLSKIIAGLAHSINPSLSEAVRELAKKK